MMAIASLLDCGFVCSSGFVSETEMLFKEPPMSALSVIAELAGKVTTDAARLCYSSSRFTRSDCAISSLEVPCRCKSDSQMGFEDSYKLPHSQLCSAPLKPPTPSFRSSIDIYDTLTWNPKQFCSEGFKMGLEISFAFVAGAAGLAGLAVPADATADRRVLLSVLRLMPLISVAPPPSDLGPRATCPSKPAAKPVRARPSRTFTVPRPTCTSPAQAKKYIHHRNRWYGN